jgi:mannose-6-phosphate isomerase-like protein (cupin superfamily)
VIGPADVPHKFINAGEGILRTINIHPSPETIGKWLED